MLKVAIVGNIASGKSTVEKILLNEGYKVYDADVVAHEILASNKDVKREFGTVDRKKLAQIVFSNPEKLKLLESIIHPLVKNEILKIFETQEKIIFISVPQLFEAGFESLFDKIIYITAEKAIRLERLMRRNHLTQNEAQVRIDAQKDMNKESKSDFVIYNNKTFEDLEKELKEILSILIR